jgi:hypothetical protein
MLRTAQRGGEEESGEPGEQPVRRESCKGRCRGRNGDPGRTWPPAGLARRGRSAGLGRGRQDDQRDRAKRDEEQVGDGEWRAHPLRETAGNQRTDPQVRRRSPTCRWRASIPSTVISAVATPPRAAAVTVTSAGSGCAESSSRSNRRCSLTSLPAGKADCRRIASRVSRCSMLTDDLPSVGWVWQRFGLASHVNPLLKLRAGAPATTTVAARQVRRRHRITVIRADYGSG